MRLRVLGVVSAITLGSIAVSAPASAAPGERGDAPVRAFVQDGALRPWLFAGVPSVRQLPTEPRARALATIEMLAKEARGLDLGVVDDVRFADGDRIVRFEQTYRGLPVIGRGAAVRMNAAGKPEVSTVRLATDLPATIIPSLHVSDATKVARGQTILPVSDRDAQLALFPVGDEVRLAWVVLPRMIPGIPTAPRIIVDAQTGDVLESVETVVFNEAPKASVFRSNPERDKTQELLTLPMPPEGGKLENAFLKTFNCIDKKRVADLNFFGQSFRARVCDLDHLAAPNAEGNYVYPPQDTPGDKASRSDAYSEVSMYYHATRAYKFFREIGGLSDTEQVVADKPFPTVANMQMPPGMMSGDQSRMADPEAPLDPFQNAFFSPAGGGLGQVFELLYGLRQGGMWFGQGPNRDYSYDGDVVYHEFVHAVVDHTLKLGSMHFDKYGMSAAPGAMNEGLADYFSAALTGDPEMGTYAAKDQLATLPYIRTLANQDTCPGAILGEVHFDSTLFSGGLWEARSTFTTPEDKKKFDAAVYKAMRTNAGRGDLGYSDLVNLILATLKTDLPPGETALRDAMTRRGVLPECSRVIEFKGAAINPPGGITSSRAFAAPGLTSRPRNGTVDLMPGIIQVKAELPPNTAKVTVTFAVAEGRGGGGGGGGGGPFGGGQQTPFAPYVLGKLDAPILWKAPRRESDAAFVVEAQLAGGKYKADIELPAGTQAQNIHIQIANGGESQGGYAAIEVATVAGDPVKPDAPAADPDGQATTVTDDGCNCSTPGHAPTSTKLAAFGAFGLLALVGFRRRRSS
jgi:MYXO-CTERM domain-containing protein